jgi:hypothetical protein
MTRAAIFLLVVILAGCDKEAKRDAAILDAQLATARIDRVEFVSWDGQATNTVAGAEAQKILVSLAATNRMSGHELKDESRRVYFMNGNERVFDFVLDDSGLWHFGAYKFCLRSR